MPEQKEAARGLLATIAITAGVVAFGVYALDLHSHTCANCGHKWRHLGAFNLGDEESHTCARCGQVQWWKCGTPHVLQGSQFVGSVPSSTHGAGQLPLSPAYGHTPPSLPYERMGYERTSLGAAYQEAPGHEYPPYEEYEQPSRLYEEAPPYRAYARMPPSRGYEEPSAYRGYPRTPQSLSYGHRPYERMSPGPSYERMPSGPSYERRLPDPRHEDRLRDPRYARRTYQHMPYERQAPSRTYAALMPGMREDDR